MSEWPFFSMEELHQIRHSLEILVQQKDQIRRAVEQLKDAPRYFTVSAWNGDLLIRRHMKGGEFTESEVLDLVLAFLQEGQQ